VAGIQPRAAQNSRIGVDAHHPAGSGSQFGREVVEVPSPADVEDRGGSGMTGVDPPEELGELFGVWLEADHVRCHGGTIQGGTDDEICWMV
jgi:hypothetical protein